jgi:peptide-methionine (R)-S-oxide reductase
MTMNEPYKTGPKSTAVGTMTRRAWLIGGGSVAVLAALWWMHDDSADAAAFEIVKSDDEWRRLLAPAAYNVLRRHGTERPFTSPLDAEKRAGIFACAGCELPLFSSETKFESGTGWPSFFKPLPDAVATSSDRSLLIPRTEVHCRRCGGHLGHVFEDGPKPTGLRYCMNGVALTFKPAAGAGPA